MDKDPFKVLKDDPNEGIKLIEIRYARKIIFRVRSYIRNDDELVKDVVQEVYIIVFIKREEIVASNNPLGLILKIAKNRAITCWKGECQMERVEVNELDNHLSNDEADRELNEKEIREQLFLKAHELTDKERNILYCVLEEGLSNKEIEVKFGLTAQDVKNVKSSGLKKVRRHFKI